MVIQGFFWPFWEKDLGMKLGKNTRQTCVFGNNHDNILEILDHFNTVKSVFTTK